MKYIYQTGKFVSRNRDLGCATFSEWARRRAKFKNNVRRANFVSAGAKNENCVIIQAQRAQDLRLRNFPSAHSIGASQIFVRPKLIYYIYVVNFHMQPALAPPPAGAQAR